MKIEKSGEQVFANVDEILAEKIISRSEENCKETRPDTGGMVDPIICGDGNDDPLQFYMPGKSTSLLKIAAAVVALLVLAKIFFGRGHKGAKDT